MTQGSGIVVKALRVRNFRSLRSIDVELDALTLLIGENNAGKTSFLDAMYAAIGAGRRQFAIEDIFLDAGEKSVPRERRATIDILIRPTNEADDITDRFPEGSFWLERWGNGVAQDEEENDFVGIRTEIGWDAARGEYSVKRNFLANWPRDPAKWDDARINAMAGLVTVAQIEPMSLNLLDAKRDIQDELTSRGSYWHRLISEPGLPDTLVTELEHQLTDLNSRIINSSDVLTHIGKNLEELYHAVSCDQGSVSITPLPRHLRDLSRGMDVQFATRNAPTFPLTRHGMGTRSLAAILIFRAYATWQLETANTERVHPMLALEEPEAHLHPQAQRALFRQIEDMPGQRILSTHSPYIVSQMNIRHVRHFKKNGAETSVSPLCGEGWEDDDIERVGRMVIATRGELLYAGALVFFEGEAERYALPIFARAFWGDRGDVFGVTFVDVGGHGNYHTFARAAKACGIPWYIFSDGEDAAVASANRALELVGESIPSDRVGVIPGGKNFETWLSCAEYQETLIDVIVTNRAQSAAHKQALRADWQANASPLAAIAEEMKTDKVRYARLCATAITSLDGDDLRIPPLIKGLLVAISANLGMDPAAAET